MYRPKSWSLWLLALIGGIILGIGSFLFFERQMILKMPWNVDLKLPHASIPNRYHPRRTVFEYPSATTQIPSSTANMKWINPFVVPPKYIAPFRKKSQGALLEYQGMIETDSGILGLVRINTIGESLIVSEGEDLVLSGIVIGKIAPKSLTYSQNGIEKVIHLGGTSN